MVDKKNILINNLLLIILYSNIGVFLSRLVPLFLADFMGEKYVEGMNVLSFIRLVGYIILFIIAYKYLKKMKTGIEILISILIPIMIVIFQIRLMLVNGTVLGASMGYGWIQGIFIIVTLGLSISKIVNYKKN